MRTPLWSRIILSALLVVPAVPAAARPEEEATPKAKIQKKHVPQTAASTQTQTAPAAPKEKGKAQTAPGKAGLRAIQGTVAAIFPERSAVIVRTSSNEYQVFVTSQTVLLRDGQPVEFKLIRPHDRVDSCHFNAKNVVQKMSVTSPEKALITPPPPPPEP